MTDPGAALQGTLVQLRARVDDHFTAARQRTPEAFACRPGCDRCCRRFAIFEVEAAPLRADLAALERRDPALRQRLRRQGRDPDDDRCALLVDGRCAVYAERPLICRSHGLPVAVDGPHGTPVVDCCPLNFASPPAAASRDPATPRSFDPPPPPASVLRLAAVNQPLALLAELWRQETDARRPLRVAIAELAAEDPAGTPDRKG